MGESSVIQMLMNSQEDLSWFNSNIEMLKSKYNNKFIAFHEKKVIDSDAELDTLIKKLKNKNVDLSSILIEFISKVRYIL